jgi:DnaK suppressor protein
MANTAEQPRERFTNFTPYEMKKGEEYMSADMLQHFKDLLLQWKQELMEEVDRTMHHMQEDAANYADPSDRATQEEEFSLELRTRDRERKLIKKIDQTIDRIDKDDYGFATSAVWKSAFAGWRPARQPRSASTAKPWQKSASARLASDHASMAGSTRCRPDDAL